MGYPHDYGNPQIWQIQVGIPEAVGQTWLDRTSPRPLQALRKLLFGARSLALLVAGACWGQAWSFPESWGYPKLEGLNWTTPPPKKKTDYLGGTPVTGKLQESKLCDGPPVDLPWSACSPLFFLEARRSSLHTALRFWLRTNLCTWADLGDGGRTESAVAKNCISWDGMG